MTTSQNPSLPQPPFFSIPNINNLRDAALYAHPVGLPTTNPPGKIRPGILYRSAEVSKLDQEGWRKIKEVGIGHVFDLRSKPEVDKGWGGLTGDTAKDGTDIRPGWIAAMEAEGVKRSWVPVFEESDYSPERLAERYLKYMGEDEDGFVQAYVDILQNAGSSFRPIFLYLAGLSPPSSTTENTFLSNDPAAKTPEKQKLGALIHCTAGKDRTGVFFAVLFSFLGVDPQSIAAEYNLTETGLRHVRDDIVARLMLSPAFKSYTSSQVAGKGLSTAELATLLQKKEGGAEEQIVPPEVLEKGRQAALRMLGARKESMLGVLEMLEREYGGAERYLREVCGLRDAELDALKRNLVVAA